MTNKENSPAAAGPGPDAGRNPSLWGDAWRRLRGSRLACLCMLLVGLFTLTAVYGEALYQFYRIRDITPPYQLTNLDEQYLAPSFVRLLRGGPETPAPGIQTPPAGARHEKQGRSLRAAWTLLRHHPLGTDGLGRDVLQRLIQGARIAFLVGVITSLIAIPIGVILGALAGYFGGRVDDVIVWIYSTFASIPTLLFILAIAMVVGRGLLGVYLAIGMTTWVDLCRLIRGEVLKHKERPYVLAARALGFGRLRIIFRHILPNVMHLVIVSFTLRFPAAIGTEVFLSFLGIGVQGEPSWGAMINQARLRLWHGVWWEMTFVTLAIFFVVLSFNLLGDALRDALDPRLRKEAE